MNTLLKLSVATAVMLTAAFGVASAQQATNPPTPPAVEDGSNAGPDGSGPDAENEGGFWGHGGRHHGWQSAEGGGDGEGEGRGGKHGRGGHGEGRGGHHGGPGGKHGMRMMDANADGVIGEDEAASMADRGFMRHDDNQDGKLTEAEFIGGKKGMRAWFGWNSDERAAVEKVRKDRFAAMDTNKDAALDKAEFFAEAKAKLAAADADKDGKVTPWEFRAAH